MLIVLTALVSILLAPQQAPVLPSGPHVYGFFTVTFDKDGTFTLLPTGGKPVDGTWTIEGTELLLAIRDAPGGPECSTPGRYRIAMDGSQLRLHTATDPCVRRKMMFDGSAWRPEGTPEPIPERRIVHKAPATAPVLPKPAPAQGGWPSFRGANASGIAERQNLPERWDATKNENILWRTPIPGLAHSSPVVWGNRIFVTTAISGRGSATFKPGLYGDGDASDDMSPHRWMLYAIDKRTGAIEWERLATEGVPRNKRHIKSTYASGTPATDGRIVVAWFGSQGVFAFDVTGKPLWSVDLGRVDMGAYDLPAFEWGPASSPILWNDLVLLQVDTQADSFILALDARTGKQVWKTDRDELPSWGTPTVITTTTGPLLVTNASNFIRGYDPRTGKEVWRLGGSSRISAPTPVSAKGLIIVASGRAPERPVFAIREDATGDLTLPAGQTSSKGIAWSYTGRGSYMPTPLIYDGIVYVLNNNGVFDAYELETGKEVYRQRAPQVGSGFSASPVAADGKIYLSSEDGDVIVIAAGREFKHLGTNPMGELLMATPALSDGVMYIRSASTLFAVGKK